jgi:hypothetical protein
MGKAGTVSAKEREGNETTSGLLPAEYVPAEQNLETIGYFSAGYKRKYPTEQQRSKLLLLSPDRKVEIVPTAKYGYPNSEDLDFYRAFLKICQEHTTFVDRYQDGQHTRHPQIRLPIAFPTARLLRYAGYVNNNHTWKGAQKWIKRCVLTGVEGGLYEAKTGRLTEGFTTALFREAYVRGDKMHNNKTADMNYIWPAPWFLSNFYYYYFRRVDLAFHQRLQKAIGKILYPILDTGWYAAQGGPYTKSYTDLCAILFIPRHKQLSLVKQQLDPSHEEIQREEFLGSWEYCKDQRGKWTGSVRWWPGDKWFRDQEERKNRKELAERIEAPKVLPVLAPPVDALPSLSAESEVGQEEVAGASERYATVVERFYTRLGQAKISRQKKEQGIDILTDLEIQGFNGEEIEVGLEWILRNKDQLGGKIYSLGLLPKVIGQALEGKGSIRKREERAQEVRETGLDSAQDEKRRRRLTEIYDALSAGNREALTAKAQEKLRQQGVKQEFLLDALVRAEVLRLVEEEYRGTLG